MKMLVCEGRCGRGDEIHTPHVYTRRVPVRLDSALRDVIAVDVRYRCVECGTERRYGYEAPAWSVESTEDAEDVRYAQVS